MVWEIPEIGSSMPSPSFHSVNKTHLVRAANLFIAHEARGCMPYVRRHTLKPTVIYAISWTAFDAKGLTNFKKDLIKDILLIRWLDELHVRIWVNFNKLLFYHLTIFPFSLSSCSPARPQSAEPGFKRSLVFQAWGPSSLGKSMPNPIRSSPARGNSPFRPESPMRMRHRAVDCVSPLVSQCF